jgi:hypothetical protein
MGQIIKKYICDVFRWWWVIVIGIVGGGISYVLKICPGFSISRWVWIGLPILGLIIAQFLAYKKLWVKYDELKSSNWINAYEKRYGKLPPVPSFMSGVVSNYFPGMVVSKNVQLITPSAQFWQRLKPSQRDQLLELVEWLGQDPRDYLAEIENMSPPRGSSMRLHRK